MRAQQQRGEQRGQLKRRLLLFGVVLAVAVLAVFTIPGIADVRERLTSADPFWIALSAVFRILSMLGFVWVLWAVFDRKMRHRDAVVLGTAEQGANVLLPAGGAGGPAMGALVMRQAGVPGQFAADRHAVLFLATSLISFVGILVAGTLTAVGVLATDASLAWSIVPAALSALVLGLCVLVTRLPRRAEPAAERRVRHAIWRLGRFVGDGLRTTVSLVRRGDRLIIGGSVAYYVFDLAALWVAFEAVGGGAPPIGDFVLAYTIGHGGALLPTPGGLGGTEGGLVGMMVVYGAEADVATAAVLGYRVFQLGLPIVLGAAAILRITAVLADPDRHPGPLARTAEEDQPAPTT